MSIGPQIWNGLPNELRSADNLKNFKNLIKNWDGSHQTTFGSKSLMSIGPQIWNGLPNELKSTVNLKNFKNLIKNWDGPHQTTFGLTV